eukprot:6458483-Amphidinium_carterae.1
MLPFAHKGNGIGDIVECVGLDFAALLAPLASLQSLNEESLVGLQRPASSKQGLPQKGRVTERMPPLTRTGLCRMPSRSQ